MFKQQPSSKKLPRVRVIPLSTYGVQNSDFSPIRVPVDIKKLNYFEKITWAGNKNRMF